MPSEKRERQRTMRAEKQAIIERQRRRSTRLRRTALLGIVAVGVVLIIVLIQISGSHSHSAAKKPTTTTASTTTTTTFPPPSTVPLTSSPVAPTCPTADETTRVVWFTKAPPDCIPTNSVWTATFYTSVGDFTVTMPADKSYAAVNNFVFLARWNYYNGTFFHRVIPGFVVQGGDPTGTGTGGPHGYPGYKFTGNYPPESCTKRATSACYQPGDFVMANSNPDSSVQNASTDGSQFFLVLPGGQTTLNTEPTYTLFGKVISGMSVVEKIGSYGTSGGTPTVKIYVTKVTVNEVTS